MAPRKSLSIAFIIGVILMFIGVGGGAFTYREMRGQRVLHETVHVLKFDPSAASQWMTAPLPLYQDGPHAVMFALSARGNNSAQYQGVIVVTVEDPGGATVMNRKLSSFGEGIPNPGGIRRYPLDTLVVQNISSSDWKMQARVISGDPQFAGSLGELVVIPPGEGEFTPYLQQNAYKLFVCAFCIVLGFLVVVFGGRKKAT